MASSRSLKLSSDGKRQVEHTLTDKAWGNDELMEAVGVQIATVKNFRAGKAVDKKNFVRFCQALGLDWAKVVEPESPPAPNSGGAEPVEKARSMIIENPEEQRIRQHCRDKILQNYSKIRLLSGQEIRVDQLYVDVWLLNRQPRTFQVSESKMLESFDLRNDRLGLGDRIKRNPGFDIANQEAKLLILGKPGAGKTTFLKHLAIDWCNGKFQANLFAIFIEFRRIREEQWQKLNSISQKNFMKDIEEDEKDRWLEIVIGEKLAIQDGKKIKSLLKSGKLLVLMDGFDEIPTQEMRWNVQNQINDLMEKYPGNRFILTCRTQILESLPDGFASVEVADFDQNQVKSFVQNWFRANNQDDLNVSVQWRIFSNAILKDASLKELSVTPVLLGLICLVLQDDHEIPTQTSSLYRRGINLLLQKWNDAKNIPEWEMGTEAYRKLDVEQKENLLIQIAAKKFENAENSILFAEDALIQQIVDHLNLPKKSDGKATLKAIEAQHGLLVERADGLWSFSHLTFQEYFATKWLLNLSSEELSQKIDDKGWQAVVQQLVKAQGESDRLLRLIKRAIDYSLSSQKELQNFLVWVLAKTKLIDALCKPTAIRAFYFALAHAFDCDMASTKLLALDMSLACAIDLDIYLVPDLDYDSLLLNLDFALDRHFNLDTQFTCAFASSRGLNVVAASEFENKLEQIRVNILTDSAAENFANWWEINAQVFREELRQALMVYRNIGHDWHFTSDQNKILQRYYDANKFLFELLKIENAVSPEARREIEDNLLLPIAELKSRLPDQYGGIEEG
jgi:predicted NACHT family NTPase/DNA-binding Xre family transcriptional regulator